MSSHQGWADAPPEEGGDDGTEPYLFCPKFGQKKMRKIEKNTKKHEKEV